MTTIYRRGKNDAGKWRYIAVNTGKDRQPENLGSRFYARVKRVGAKWQSWIPLDGDTLEQAIPSAEKLEKGMAAKAAGFDVAGLEDMSAPDKLTAKIAKYVEETKANKSAATHRLYRDSLNYFAESCKRVLVADVDREDMLRFKTFLYDKELAERTVANHFLNVMTFLKWCGINAGVKKGDWPVREEREVEEYSTAELTALLKAARPDERLLLNSFLCSGMRSGEIGHLTYGDIDFERSIWIVRPKAEWKTKTQTARREIPVPSWLTAKILERKQSGKWTNAGLIFPNTLDAPDENLLRFVKRVAKRARVTGRVDDHKFHSTAITRWLREGNSVQDVMTWVGHKDLKVILRYLAKINIRKPENRQKAEQAFAEFANIGY
jgi:integrase